MRVITVCGLKGGVGKTTSAVHLAAWWSRRGSTLLVDADPQGSALSWVERAEPAPGFDVAGLPTRQLGRQLPGLAAGRDTVVVDTGPGQEHREIVLAALAVSNLAVLPVAPSYMEHDRLDATLELVALAETANPGLQWRVLLTRVRQGTASARVAPEVLAGEWSLPLLAAQVPLHERYMQAFGTPLDADLGAYEAVGSATAGLLAAVQGVGA